MSPFIPISLSFVSLVALVASSTADQVNEFSVFQPVDGISANIYIDKTKVMVQASNTKTTALNHINPEYLKRYADKIYKIGDVDHNGTVDIATLDRVDRASSRFCYKVFSYHPNSRKYSNRPTYTECDSATGTVIYATNGAIVANR